MKTLIELSFVVNTVTKTANGGQIRLTPTRSMMDEAEQLLFHNKATAGTLVINNLSETGILPFTPGAEVKVLVVDPSVVDAEMKPATTSSTSTATSGAPGSPETTSSTSTATSGAPGAPETTSSPSSAASGAPGAPETTSSTSTATSGAPGAPETTSSPSTAASGAPKA